MARLFTCGFELADVGNAELNGWLVGGSGTYNYDTSFYRSGGASFYCKTTSTTNQAYLGSAVTIVASRTYYGRAYFYLPDATPSGTVGLVGWANSVGIRLTSAGKLQLWQDYGTDVQIGSDSAAISDGSWVCVELKLTADSGPTNFTAVEARLDGTAFASSASVSVPAAFPDWGVGSPDSVSGVANFEAWLDDIAINDSSGAAQTDYPGPGKVGWLVPISDNARGNWTGGSGGTTNLYDALNNKPPVGKAAASETNTTQIKTNTTTVPANCDMNCAAYDATIANGGVGAAAGSTVALVQLVAAVGSEQTNTDNGSMLIVSNPTQSSADTFAFAQASACGTYPTNWLLKFGSVQYAPTVTLSTAPVIRVTKTQTQARMADCCFLGLVVEWTEPESGTQANAGVASATASAPASADSIAASPGIGSATASANAPTITTGKNVDAGVASATGSASAPGRSSSPSIGSASATGTATGPTITLGINAWPGVAQATGTATGPVETIAPSPSVATGTGTASTPSPALLAPIGAASATGSATNPTISTAVETFANAGAASATATALTPSITAYGVTNVNAGAATATASAPAAADTIAPYPAASAATGTAWAIGGTASASIGYAQATATAETPTVNTSAGTNAQAGNASATAAANAPTIAYSKETVTGVAEATATAPTAAAVAGTFVSAGYASATGTASGVVATVALGAPLASASATAPSVTTVPGKEAAAGLASATGTAQTAAPTVAPPAGVASATAAANVPSITTSTTTSVNAGVASATGTAYGPTITAVSGVFANAGYASATGTAFAPGLSVAGSAVTATAVGEAFAIMVYIPSGGPGPSGTAIPVYPAANAASSVPRGTASSEVPRGLA